MNENPIYYLALAICFGSLTYYLLSIYGDLLRWLASKSLPLVLFVSINFLVVLAPDVYRINTADPPAMRSFLLDIALGFAVNTGLVLLFLLMRAATAWTDRLQDEGRRAQRLGEPLGLDPYAAHTGWLGRLRSHTWRSGWNAAKARTTPLRRTV